MIAQRGSQIYFWRGSLALSSGPHTATASVVSSSNLSRTSPLTSTAALHFHDHSQHTFLLHIFLILIFEQEINRHHVVGGYEEPGVMFANGVGG
jgi:hypothetical protein